MGTHHLWGNTTTYLWGYLAYGDIPLLGNMVREHRTYGDTPTIGKHHLRGHSTSGDTPSRGNTREYHTAYGEAPPMGTSPYLLKLPNLWGHPTYGDILPKGTFHFLGYIIYGGIPSMREYHTAYGEEPWMGTSPYLLKRPTWMGTFHLSGHPTFGDILPKGTFHVWGYTIYEEISSMREYHTPMGKHHGWGHLLKHSTF